MLLILEIVFTIAAWNVGWKAKALIPVLCGLFTGFMTGIICTSIGVAVPIWVLAVDILVVLILVGMTLNGPNNQ